MAGPPSWWAGEADLGHAQVYPETAFYFVAEEITGPIPGCPDQKMGPSLLFNPELGAFLKEGYQPTLQV